MVELWFGIAAVMLTAHVVLDGFDRGAGALHLFVASSDRERRQVLGAIGPFWDGNEVWLLATGGALFAAFRRVLASRLSAPREFSRSDQPARRALRRVRADRPKRSDLSRARLCRRLARGRL